MFAALGTILEEGVGEITSGLDQVARENNAHCDKLNDVSHVVNALREMVLHSGKKQALAIIEARIAYVTQVNEALAAQGDRLNEVSQSMSTLGEKFDAVAEDAVTKCLERLEQINAELSQCITTDENLQKKVTQAVLTFEGILAKALERATETICNKCERNVDRIAASKANEMESRRKESAVKKNTCSDTTH